MVEIAWHMGMGNLVGCLRSRCMIFMGDGIGCIHNVRCEVGSDDTPNHRPCWPIDLFVLSLLPPFSPKFWFLNRGKTTLCFLVQVVLLNAKKENNLKGT